MINDIDVNEREVSNKLPFDKQYFKYYIANKNNRKIRPFCIFFQKGVYIKDILLQINVCVLMIIMKIVLINIWKIAI